MAVPFSQNALLSEKKNPDTTVLCFINSHFPHIFFKEVTFWIFKRHKNCPQGNRKRPFSS